MINPKIGKDVQQQLDEIQQKVQKAKKQIKYVWLFAGVIALISFLIGIFSGQIVSFFVSGLSIFGASSVHTYLSKKSTSGFKINIMQKVINNDDDLGIKYYPNDFIPLNEFKASKLYNRYIDRYNGEDLFIGIRGKTAFRFSEIKAEEKQVSTNSKGHIKTTYSTIFKGVFFIAEFNKNIKGFTRVYIGNDSFFEKLFAGKSKVKLENVAFEKTFNTYSTDQVEARYILTPDMMERILKLKERLNTKISLSFAYNLVFIAIPQYDDNFELDSNAPADKAQIKRILNEMDSFVQIIDELNLNLRIWGEV